MKGYRALELGGSASLSAVCRHIKLARAGDLHGAIEDAWLAMQIYLWLAVMSAPVITVSEDTELSEIAHVLVTPARGDLLRALAANKADL
jgi:hypothetical protein